MKSVAAVMVLSMVWGAGKGAAKSKPVMENRVSVYLNLGRFHYTGVRVTAAINEASRLFQAAGIQLDWKDGNPRRNETGRVVVIRFVAVVPEAYCTRENANVMAAAKPYGDGPHSITVFGDRVTGLLSQFNDRLAARVLGHVLAHELGHVVEGVVRHSETGPMKAHWTASDYSLMAANGLAFDRHDVDLLRNSFGRTLMAAGKR